MARYIDADEIISQIESNTAETWGKGLGRAWWSHAVMLKDNIVRLIRRAPTADVAPKAEWISVEERLPEKHGRYLAAFTDTRVDTVTYTKIGWFYEKRCSITHWMPLPEPPKRNP